MIRLLFSYFGGDGLANRMEDTPNREEEYQRKLEQWQSEEPHDQCESYTAWLNSKPKKSE